MRIQAAQRRSSERWSYVRVLGAVRALQRGARMLTARRRRVDTQARATRIQAFARALRARRAAQRAAARALLEARSARRIQRAVREWLILRVFCDAFDGLGKTIDVGFGSAASPAPFGAGTLGALGAADEPRTLSADSFADAKALCSSGGYSIFAKWIEELTPRAKVP